ncbi:MAG: corrinoid protein [Desulfobacterales bacterium]|nr:corrinoid protein [Desulfobacterales bacterium]
MSEKTFEEAAKAIIAGDAATAADLARRGLDEGIEPLILLDQGFVPGINEVGDLFSKGKLFIPGLIKSAAAMEKATEIINAAIPQEAEIVQGKIVLGTVQGDVHDIGKTIVVALFKANGFEVLDLGRDVPNDKIIEEAEKFGADIIGTSTLLTTTMALQKELEEDLNKAGLREKYKTIIGGAPVTQRWADRIGADAYAHDASDGVQKAKALLNK